MQNPSPSNQHIYLSRLALLADAGTGSVNPYSIIKDFFSFGPVTEMKDLFDEACKAALSETYSWKEGAPGNLLYFYDQLEKLIEACFIITSDTTVRKINADENGPAEKKILRKITLPCSLTIAEMKDPVSVLQAFFELQNLKKWKQDLYSWLEAGLSNYTVLEMIEAKDILPYYYRLLKLIDACYCILFLHKRKKPGKNTDC